MNIVLNNNGDPIFAIFFFLTCGLVFTIIAWIYEKIVDRKNKKNNLSTEEFTITCPYEEDLECCECGCGNNNHYNNCVRYN